jgi:hypothetical protein
MQPDFPSRFPLEMLNRVGDVNGRAINTGRLEAFIKQLTGRTYKWPAYLIFTITRLFTHKQDCGMRFSLAEHYLGSVPVKITPLAMLSRLSQASEIVARRQKLQS